PDESLRLTLDPSKVPVPPILKLIGDWGGLDKKTMYNTFNMGIGFAVVVAESDAQAVVDAANTAGESAYILGSIEKRGPGEDKICII
ncbi:MAG: AIR synthase-related protein, partial [Defluviitaleaceae bacterium]|nr:AIR synthase-related protein [Defluviitaleaceae bacterium]